MTSGGELQKTIKGLRSKKPILLMSHLVLGYPSFEENARAIETMITHGVDLMELQIPFSEPSADGPLIAQANQRSIEQGFRVSDGLDFIEKTVERHNIPFLIMSYYNILFAYGVKRFIQKAAHIGVKGLIIPDLPLEEAGEAMRLCQTYGLDWIQLMTPTCRDERLQSIGDAAQGFCYCVARKGVTGKTTQFDKALNRFMRRCRTATQHPIAIGFGVKTREDVAFLENKAEIAVVGTAAIHLHKTQGVEALGDFFSQLRED